jgi:hypothetical protein
MAKNSIIPIVKVEAETIVPMMWPQELARLPANNKIAELKSGRAISQSKFSDVCMIIS